MNPEHIPLGEGVHPLPQELRRLAVAYRELRQKWRSEGGVGCLRVNDRAEALETILADCLRHLYGISLQRNITIPTAETFQIGAYIQG